MEMDRVRCAETLNTAQEVRGDPTAGFRPRRWGSGEGGFRAPAAP